MNRILLLLLPVGPFCVAVLRFLLPYYTAGDEVATAQAVIDHPSRESAVLWLGLVAILTLLPGLITVAGVLPAGAWKTWAMALCIPGYLCLGPLLTQDYLLSSGAASHLAAQQIGAEVAALHPSYDVATAIFVVGHVLGTVLLGIALLRSRLVPAWAAWLVAVSQPLHFVAAVAVGSPVLDLLAWSMTGVGLAVLADRLLRRTPTPNASKRTAVPAGR
jgi:hypothetical protein